MTIPVLQGADSKSATEGSQNLTSLPVATPDNMVVGDGLLIVVATDHGNPVLPEHLPPSGGTFTEVQIAGANNADTVISGWFRLWDGTETSLAGNWTTGVNNSIVWALRITEVNQTAPLDVIVPFSSGGSSLTHVIGGGNTTVVDCLAMYLFAADGGDTLPHNVSGTGWARDFELSSGTGAGGVAASLGSKQVPVAGATGDATITMGSSDGACWFQFAIAGTAAAPADPVIVGQATTAITSTTATGNVTTDTVSGTMYGGVWPAASTPSIADIKAGTGAIAGTASNQTVSSANLAFPVTGLTAETDYKFHFVQTATTDSNQVEDAFTTLALVKTVNARFADINGVDRADLTNVVWAWYDALPATGVGPVEFNNTGTTDALGNFSADVSKSTLSDGQTGYLVVSYPANNWTGIYALTVTAT